MKIIVEQTAGKDYPIELKDHEPFYKSQREGIRQKLELRPQDEIEIREV
jgi:hypothetical protein